MKRFLILLLVFTGAMAAKVAFHACQADDEADSQLSPKAQLLLKKSREFAKKYNVDMTLNEDNIEETPNFILLSSWIAFTGRFQRCLCAYSRRSPEMIVM